MQSDNFLGIVELPQALAELHQLRKNQEQLQERASLLSIALHLAHVGSWKIELPERRLVWSEKFVSIGELPLDASISVDEAFQLIAPEYREKAWNAFNACERNGTPYDIEVQILAPGGTRHWVRTIGQAVRDASGTISQIQGIFQDITEKKQAEQTFRESMERFQIVAKATTDAIWDWDIMADRVWWSDSIQRVFGYSADEIGNDFNSWINRLHPEDREQVVQSILTAINESKDDRWRGEYRFLRKDGSYAYVLSHGFLIRNPEGTAVRMAGSMVDITERKEADIQHQKDQARIRHQASLLDKAQDAIIVTDLDFRIRFWNKSAERLYGWTAEEAIGKSKNDLLFIRAGDYSQALHALMQQGDWRGEIRKQRKDGSILTVEVHWTLVRDESGKPQSILAIDTDITQRKEAEREIERLAFFDPLTRLPNRRLLADRLQHALASAARSHKMGALLFIDLDNFKSLNDTLGHDKGDLLLQQVALRLEICVPRKSDTVARLGGDEFVVMLEDLSEDSQEAATQAERVGEKILAAFNQPFEITGHEHHTTSSIGAALFDKHVSNVDELLKRADLAMYQAKAAGRNAIRFYDPEMQTIVTNRVALETDLRHGLQRHEFLLHYQPQVDDDGRKIGFEALVRWRHPRRGLVSPALFIPRAEETGLILPLGRWVLETACKQLALWAKDPDMAHLSISVNVSPHQFRHADFVQMVLEVLDRSGARPERLKLELTENVLVENVEDTVRKMTALKTKNVCFSLDDFGTGYSSLSYLKRLPLDQLKIDRSFVKDVLTDPNDAAIACTIVALAQTLGLQVMAEGVETVAQRDFLAGHGCHAYQGYLFGHPLPIEQCTAL